MGNIVLQVEGMKCGGCESSVKGALEAIDGVSSVKADHRLNRVEVEMDPLSISVESIKQAIVKQGYTVIG